MTVLTVATLTYAGVLVVALAASLITILVYLVRIGRALGEVEEALAGVARETAPLHGPFERLEQAVADSAAEVTTAEKKMDQARRELDRRSPPIVDRAASAGGA